MITLFLLEGFWLYLSLGVWLVVLGTSVYSERYTLATLDVLALVGLLSVTGHIHLADTWSYILHNPLVIVGIVLAYLAVGVAWARIKWGLLIARLKTQVEEWKTDRERQIAREKENFEREQSKDHLPDHLRGKGFTPSRAELSYELLGKVTLDENGRLSIVIDRYKSRIIGWAHYWPMSALMWFLGDFIHDVYEAMYRRVRGYFQRLADDALNA